MFTLFTSLATLLGLLVTALTVYGQRRTFYHCRIVKAGKLYRSGLLKNNLCFLLVTRCLGINTLINLRSKRENGIGTWYQQQRFMCVKLGIEMIDIPIVEDTPPSAEQIQLFCDLVDRPGRRTLVHCEYGIIRTGMMVVAYAQRSLGESATEARRHMLSFGHRLQRHPQAMAFVAQYSPGLPA